MSYQSYKVKALVLKDFKNTCSVCKICDFTKVCGFIRFNGGDVDNAKNYFDMKELLETRYSLTLFTHSYVDKDDVIRCVADKVMHYINGVGFVVAVVMN